MTRLAPLLLAACSGIAEADPSPTPTDVELARAATLRLTWQGGEVRAGCTGVAVGPRTWLTVAHCRMNQWHYLTREAWGRWGAPQPADLVACGGEVRSPAGGTDGWCEYRTADDLPAWLEPASECQGAVVHVGMGTGFDWDWTSVRVLDWGRDWLATDMRPTGGDSGGPIVCSGRVVGMMTLSSGHAIRVPHE